ncbi:PhoH-like protein, partial [Roseobacter sp. AzwK-3b]
MVTTQLPTPPDPDALHEAVVEFPDNRLLIDLCGEYDRHLADIEQKMSVQILRRGNQLVVVGAAIAARDTIEVLQALYQRLESGKPVGPGDVDRELRMGADLDGSATRDGDQLEMFKGGPVEIKTRKKLVEPRTDAQKAYVKSLFAHEMA